MAKPAGVQIQRWFSLLVGLLVAVNVAALGGNFILSRSVGVVVERAEPLASATASIRHEILAAQRELFRYLAEFSDDTSAALGHLDALERQLAQARGIAVQDRVTSELDAIARSAERYRKVLELMPSTVEGSRDWTRLQEYSATAVDLGSAVEAGATRLAEAAQEEIHDRGRNAARIVSGAMWASAAVLTLSLITVVAFRISWRRLQDLILDL